MIQKFFRLRIITVSDVCCPMADKLEDFLRESDLERFINLFRGSNNYIVFLSSY